MATAGGYPAPVAGVRLWIPGGEVGLVGERIGYTERIGSAGYVHMRPMLPGTLVSKEAQSPAELGTLGEIVKGSSSTFSFCTQMSAVP